MQIYIHVPFCRTKCHYCSFYSVPTVSSQTTPITSPDKNFNNIAASGIGINLFDANDKTELYRQLLNSKKKTHPPTDTINVKSKTVKSLSTLIPKISEQNTKKSQGVQSLADILRSKKDTTISQKAKISQATGPTLADALLSKDQAKDLRESLGYPLLEENEIKSNKSSPNPASLYKDTSNAKSIFSSTQEIQVKKTSQSIQSLFLGKTLQHEELNNFNADMRTASSGANISTLDQASRIPLPLLLPKNFIEHNTLSNDPLYQLWKKALLTEIKIFAEFYSNTPITSIFFGGGTPSLVLIKDMETILRTIFKNFHVTHNAEISMEANPESITKEKAIAYSRMGFNRISLGIQSLQDSNLQTMGRIHSAMGAIQAFHTLRDARFHNISIDLMWGLPNQTNKNWVADIKEAINLDPEHISCYGLSIDEGSIFEEWEEEGRIQLPNEKEQALMYKTSAQRLKEAGYLQYEISNFSKIGYQCRHNVGYWQGADYIGLGPSAAGTINNVRRTHANSIIEWAQDIQSNNLAQDIRFHIFDNMPPMTSEPNFTKEILSPLNQALELIMLRLRTSKGLALSEYKKLTGRSFMNDNKSLIHILNKHDLLRANKGYIFLTLNGMLVSTSILERFFENTKSLFTSANKY